MSRAFQLEVDGTGLATLTLDVADKTLNVFDREVLTELDALIAELAVRRDVSCLVLVSGKKRGFIAGMDVGEIAAVTEPAVAEEGARFGQRLFAAWEALPFPTVAAIDGVCVGGGTELALASTWRVASDRPETRIGLPEVRLGILPGWGGCSRLPRTVGLPAALELILSGKTVSARRARALGLIDELLPAAGFERHLHRFAAGRGNERRHGGGGGLAKLLLAGNPLGRKLVFDRAEARLVARTGGHYPAPLAALEVVRTGLERGRQAGFDAEARAIGELAVSAVAKNLIHVFRLTEAAKKRAVAGEAREVRQAAVLGAGTMGGGIAQLIAGEADVPVRLKDLTDEALGRALAHAAARFEKQVGRRRLSRAEARRKLALIRPTTGETGLARADLVIEAVAEELGVKRRVFAETAASVGPRAVLASNTSSLSITAIAAGTSNPERVVGMHFFNPVDKMPLVEVIAGERSSPEAVATAFMFARRLGKIPLPVADSPGFLVNRLLIFLSVEALRLLDEGSRIETIDGALTAWGLPLGPLAVNDEVGLDVAVEVARVLSDAFGDRLEPPSWLDRLPAAGRLGRKSGAGFYRYRGGERRGPAMEIYELVGREPRRHAGDRRQLVDRMVLPMVNEAARCLAEGVVAGAGELDLALILGAGFPPFRGGLCRWADAQGPGRIVERLERLADLAGPRFAPSPALVEAAAAGGLYARFGGAKTAEPG